MALAALHDENVGKSERGHIADAEEALADAAKLLHNLDPLLENARRRRRL